MKKHIFVRNANTTLNFAAYEAGKSDILVIICKLRGN